jgi:hypothetical protein
MLVRETGLRLLDNVRETAMAATRFALRRSADHGRCLSNPRRPQIRQS